MRAADPRTRIANRQSENRKKTKRKSRVRPGDVWRVQAFLDTADGVVIIENAGEFDELVVGEPCWIHVEQMDTREWWLNVGEHDFGICIGRDGKPRLRHYELGDMDALLAVHRKKDIRK